MRIVYKDGNAYKVDSLGRLVPSKTRRFGSGRFHGESTVVMRVPASLAADIRLLILRQLEHDDTDYSNYTTPGFENAEVVDND